MRLGQTKLESAIETGVSIAIGFCVAFAANLVILPLFGFHPDLWANFWLTVFFTFVSIIRGFLVRRLFNYWHEKRLKKHFETKEEFVVLNPNCRAVLNDSSPGWQCDCQHGHPLLCSKAYQEGKL